MAGFTSTTEKVTVEQRGHILLIGLNRPEKKNAFDVDMLQGLSAAYTELSDNKELRVGIVHAVGDAFTAGLDLSNVFPHFVKDGTKVFTVDGGCDPYRLYGRSCEKPVMLAVKGYCYTAGIELALAADMVVAQDNTKFGQIEVKRGIFPFGGATFRLPALMGWHNAMRYMTTGEIFSAEQAQQFGLVQEITTDDPLDKALELATMIAENAPLGVMGVLKHARKVFDPPPGIAEALQADTTVIGQSKDAMEGVMSLIEKRKAVFTGE